MKTAIFVLFTILFMKVSAQEKPMIYNPDADARADIAKAVDAAKKSGKHVLIQVGGNWCPWCIRLHQFLKEDKQLDSALNADYIFILVNYEKKNWNKEVMQSLGFPQRFGFPVLVVLDANGHRIHTQNTAYLEEGEGYSKKKLMEFFRQWRAEALRPESYIVK